QGLERRLELRPALLQRELLLQPGERRLGVLAQRRLQATVRRPRLTQRAPQHGLLVPELGQRGRGAGRSAERLERLAGAARRAELALEREPLLERRGRSVAERLAPARPAQRRRAVARFEGQRETVLRERRAALAAVAQLEQGQALA